VVVPLDKLRVTVLDALDCSVPLAPRPLDFSVGLRFDDASQRYVPIISKAADKSDQVSTVSEADSSPAIVSTLSTAVKAVPPLTPHVIHIGAHTEDDPTRFWVERHGWTATLVEPDPALAAVLSRSYSAAYNASVVVASGALGCAGTGATRPFWSEAKLQADEHGDSEHGYFSNDRGARVGGVSLLDAKCLTAAELLTTSKPLGASAEGAAPLVLVVGAQGAVDRVLAQVLSAEGLRPHLLMFQVESYTTEKRTEVVALILGEGYNCGLMNPGSVVCARRKLVGNAQGSSSSDSSDDQGVLKPHQALLHMFDVECWCPHGFGRLPFSACTNGGVGPPGCADPAATSPADATRELGRVFSESASSWWAPGLPDTNLKIGSVAFSFQQVDGHISGYGYEYFNRARSISEVTVPFSTAAAADGPPRVHSVTWFPRNYDVVTREVVSAAALAIVQDMGLRGEALAKGAAAQLAAALWGAVDGQCAFWGAVECDFPGAGEPRPVNGDPCCFAAAGDERGGGVFKWVPPRGELADRWTRVAEPLRGQGGAEDRHPKPLHEEGLSVDGSSGGACSHRGERGSCADAASGGAWLWKTEGEGRGAGSACVKYDPREQEAFRAALPSLFPSVAATGRGVVDFGGSIGMYAAAFPPEAGRRVTVEPLVDPACLFPGVALDSRNYLAEEPPLMPLPLPPQGAAEEGRRADPTFYAGGYELVVSLETAEHVAPVNHPRLVRWLARAVQPDSRTARLLFSAAMPSQHGDGHVGCKPPARWRRDIERWSAEAGAPLELDRSRTEAARKAAGPYLTHILLVFHRVNPRTVAAANTTARMSSSLDAAATGAYTGAATVLRHVCVEDGALVLFEGPEVGPL
jgi:hypothetical protein